MKKGKDGTKLPTVRTAAAYIRVSTEDQIEYSPDAQIAEIRKFAAREGYILPGEYIYVDEGISGKGTKKRDAFNVMIGTAKTKPRPFDVILVWKFSRFARSREDSVIYKSMLRRDLEIDVVSITEPLSDEKTSIILEAVIEAMDEYYSINLAEEVKRGMTEAARRGKLQGAASFGYKAEEGTLVPLPEEAALVREIFERFASGEGLFPLAKWLNDMGVKTHRGGVFENRTVEYILRNPVYIGKLRWNPTGRTRRDFTNENIIVADSNHEPIIDNELWTKVQERMAEVKARWKYHGRPSTELKEWPSGLVRCATCKSTLIFSAPHFYKCNGYARGSCKTSQHIHIEAIKDAILRQLESDRQAIKGLMLESSAGRPQTAENLRSIGGHSLKYEIVYSRERGGDELERYNALLSENERKTARLRDAFLAGVESLDEYKEMKEALGIEASRLRNSIEEVENRSKEENTDAALQDAISKALIKINDASASIAEKHDAAASVIKDCFFDKQQNKLSITYRLFF